MLKDLFRISESSRTKKYLNIVMGCNPLFLNFLSNKVYKLVHLIITSVFLKFTFLLQTKLPRYCI